MRFAEGVIVLKRFLLIFSDLIFDSKVDSLVEYGDSECPSCGSAYPIVKRVQKQFGKRLRFVATP